MKKINVAVILFIILFSLLNSKPKKIEFSFLKKCENYPRYELVEQGTIEEYQRNKTKKIFDFNLKSKKIKRQDGSNLEDEIVTLYDKSGKSYWSLNLRKNYDQSRIFSNANNGITAVASYDKSNEVVWMDENGEIINRLELEEYQLGIPTPLKEGEYWLIKTIFNSMVFEENPEIEEKNLSGIIICDSFGRKLRKIKLKYKEFGRMDISKNQNYIM